MIISYSRRFIFVHIHKTGGDSISTALSPVLSREDVVLKNDWHDWLQSRRSEREHPEISRLRKHSPAAAIARAVPTELWADSFTFAFVRHPVGRTVSLYKYAARKAAERRKVLPRNMWYLTPPGRSGDPLRWQSVRAYWDAPSFSEFIRHPLLDHDVAMRPQWDSVRDGSDRVIVDFVGRFEQLQDDFHQVQDRLGVPRTLLGWHNASRDPGGIMISDDDRGYLAERFKDDFLHFGYDASRDS